nr:MAG TPA: hypothetical protein [Caudoviricetes sp.]
MVRTLLLFKTKVYTNNPFCLELFLTKRVYTFPFG